MVLCRAFCWLLACCSAPPELQFPELTIPESLDPEILSLVNAQLEKARQDPSDPEQLGQLGLVFEANVLWRQARQCFSAAADRAPEDPVWAYHAARASQYMGDFDGAFTAMRVVAEGFPSFAPAQHHLGELLLESGDIDGAEAAFQRAVTLREKSPEGYLGLGGVALQRRDYAAAVAALEHALALDPGHKMAAFLVGRAYRRLGRIEDADRVQAQGQNAVKTYIPDRTASDLPRYTRGYSARLDQSAQLLNAGRPQEAIIVLEKMHRDRPRDTNIMNNLSVAYRRVNRIEDALAILDKSVEVDPDLFATYINRSYILCALQRYPEALADADAGIERSPETAQAHYARGKALLFMSEYAQARGALETAIGLDNRTPMFHQALAGACLRLEDNAGARAALEELIRISPRDLVGLTTLGMVYVNLEDWAGARRALDAARELEPTAERVKQLEKYYAERKP